MAGDCHTSMIYNWNCGPGFNGSPNEQITQTTSSTDNPDFTLTSEQIKEIHAQYAEKFALDQNLNFSLDSYSRYRKVNPNYKFSPTPPMAISGSIPPSAKKVRAQSKYSIKSGHWYLKTGFKAARKSI